MTSLNCQDCGKLCDLQGTYAIDKDDNRICYDCCGKRDESYMREHGRNTLYLTIGTTPGTSKVTNWPGTFSRGNLWPKRSRHNIARWRYDVWFPFDGYLWHGVTYGDNTQICHCRKTKTKAACLSG